MSDAYDINDPKHPDIVDNLQERLDSRDPLDKGNALREVQSSEET